MELIKSFKSFVVGILKRIYWVLVAVLVDPFGLLERFGVNYTPPDWLTWVLVGVGFLIAGGLTYHDLRKKHGGDEKRQETVDALGRQLEKGDGFLNDIGGGYVAWCEEVDEWERETEEMIREGLTQGETSLFRSPPGGGSFSWGFELSPEHKEILNEIHWKKEALAEIIRRNSPK